MISHASIAVTDKGMELLSLLVSTTTPRSLGKKNTTSSTSSSSSSSSKIEWMALSQACIKFVVKCPDPSRRSHCWKTWSLMLKAFSLTTEYELLRQLVAICPHNNIVGMLIDATTKNCMARNGKYNQAKGEQVHRVYGCSFSISIPLFFFKPVSLASSRFFVI